MISQQWWAGGLALFSLGLAVGWSRLRFINPSLQKLEERWPGCTARFFYFVGLPYIAIVSGVLAPKLLGLIGVEYFAMIDLDAATSTAELVAEIEYALVLMLLEWFINSQSMIISGLIALVIMGGVCMGLVRTGIVVPDGPKLTVIGVIYYGLHWAYYRAVIWSVTGDFYLGVVLGAGFVIGEEILVALAQENWSSRQRPYFLSNIILILTATVFYYSPNLWLLWLVQGGMVVLVKMVGVTEGSRKQSRAHAY